MSQKGEGINGAARAVWCSGPGCCIHPWNRRALLNLTGSPATEEQDTLQAQLLCAALRHAALPPSVQPSSQQRRRQNAHRRQARAPELRRRSPQWGRPGCTGQQSQARVPVRRQRWAWPGRLRKAQRLRRRVQALWHRNTVQVPWHCSMAPAPWHHSVAQELRHHKLQAEQQVRDML